MTIIRNYTELERLRSFEERFEYLKLKGSVGRETFGYDRYLNQRFYTSTQWRNVRQFVIARDNASDLGISGFEIYDQILIHHMNPISPEDILQGNEDTLNPEFLITTTHTTHNAIHYGDPSLIPNQWSERRPGDTDLW